MESRGTPQCNLAQTWPKRVLATQSGAVQCSAIRPSNRRRVVSLLPSTRAPPILATACANYFFGIARELKSVSLCKLASIRGEGGGGPGLGCHSSGSNATHWEWDPQGVGFESQSKRKPVCSCAEKKRENTH